MDILKQLAQELKLPQDKVEKAVQLLDEGNTVPFISRYRKEVTGSMDDTVLRNLEDRLHYLRNLDKRREEISALIEGQGQLTPEITEALNRAVTLVELEDIYLPFRPKRKTRASVARQRGLEPLASLIMEQRPVYDPTIEQVAAQYVDPEKEVNTPEEALAGAKDILAEDIANTAEYRKMLRQFLFEQGVLRTRQDQEGDSVYEGYYDFSEPVSKIRGHRILAINRGEKEGFLKVTLEADEEAALGKLFALVITCPESPAVPILSEVIRDSYERLLFPSLEREVRNELFDNACEGALKLFAENLRSLLLAAPLKGKTVLGFDPGFRTGCKLAVVDKTGKVLDTGVIYPTDGPKKNMDQAAQILTRLIKKWQVDVIALGNGTASRESEQFIASLLPQLDRKVMYVIVSESGASVYSASKQGAAEFPDFDVTQRSAVSIARRLQDPLAELVKIEPKAIGVGQYQHDMKPARLDESLGNVVEDCVNSVGVDVNTASASLLSYISGINAAAAKNIVAYREENGEFLTREEIMKVPKIGAKAYQQCVGFLRIPDGEEIFDNTGVHPESYPVARELLAHFHYTSDDVRHGNLADLKTKIKKEGTARLAQQLGCGEPTLIDIADELSKPGRDIRDSAPAPFLRTDVLDIKDLKEDMLLTGTVRNIVDFGAFVDIGVHHDGLLHVSEISDRFIRHPSEALSIGDVIEVRVKSVDLKKNRIGLSCKNIKH